MTDAETIRAAEWLASARQQLAQNANSLSHGDQQNTTAGLESQVLLASVLERPRSWVLAHPEALISNGQLMRANHMLERLADGEPLPYLIGHWEFFGLDFLVNPSVLIPRPETELLVEHALQWLMLHPGRLRAADVGTGSGCVAVSLAKHAPALNLIAVDRSPAALDTARKNAERNGVSQQITFVQGNLLDCCSHPLDLVCANLPYIPRETLSALRVARYEPREALDGGPDGLDTIRALIADVRRWLAPGGLLLLEMQYDQGDRIAGYANEVLPGATVTIVDDLAGLPRLVRIENSKEPR